VREAAGRSDHIHLPRQTRAQTLLDNDAPAVSMPERCSHSAAAIATLQNSMARLTAAGQIPSPAPKPRQRRPEERAPVAWVLVVTLNVAPVRRRN